MHIAIVVFIHRRTSCGEICRWAFIGKHWTRSSKYGSFVGE